MDLGLNLANLSLAEIASMLSSRQQEVLLASISVAANLIQQLQEEERERQQLEDPAQNFLQRIQQAQQLSIKQDNSNHKSQQKELQHNNSNNYQNVSINSNNNNNNNNNNNSSNNLNSSNNHLNLSKSDNLSHLTQQQLQQVAQQQLHQHQQHSDDLDEELDDEQGLNDQSSEASFEDYSYTGQTDHSQTADAETLATIKQFAEELKYRRKIIKLSQKGAAQSLRAYTSGEQPCTDAIIYHFENLQLEPDRAMQLIPLLRNWLEWAEKHRLSGKQLPMMSAVTKVPRERKRKVVLFNDKAKQYLEDAFSKNNHPDRYQLDVISQELQIPTRSIRKWFTNRRQRKRFAEKFSPIMSP